VQKKKNIITILDIVVLISFFAIIKRYLVDTFVLNNISDGRGKVIKVIKHYYNR
jgi:hypothetical protein